MTNLEAVAHVADALESLQVEYVIVGALATNVYGIPRATNDADFVVALEAGNLSQLISELGDSFRLERQMRLEPLTGTARNNISFVPTGFLIELFRLSDDPHHQELFARRIRLPVPELGRDVWLPTAEDLVIQKLRWGRDKDRVDAVNVVAVQSDTLDVNYIRAWCAMHETVSEFDSVLRQAISVPDQ